MRMMHEQTDSSLSHLEMVKRTLNERNQKNNVIKQTRTSINIQVWGRSSYRGKKLRFLVSTLILGYEKGLIL